MRESESKSSISRAMRQAWACMIPRKRSRAAGSSRAGPCRVSMNPVSAASGGRRRSEEHTSGLHSHRDLPSFPTRRSSDLGLHDTEEAFARGRIVARRALQGLDEPSERGKRRAQEIGRAHVWTAFTPRSTLFPYTTLFRSGPA